MHMLSHLSSIFPTKQEGQDRIWLGSDGQDDKRKTISGLLVQRVRIRTRYYKKYFPWRRNVIPQPLLASDGGRATKRMAIAIVLSPLVPNPRPNPNPRSLPLTSHIGALDTQRKWRIGAASAAPGVDLKALEAAIEKVSSLISLKFSSVIKFGFDHFYLLFQISSNC